MVVHAAEIFDEADEVRLLGGGVHEARPEVPRGRRDISAKAADEVIAAYWEVHAGVRIGRVSWMRVGRAEAPTKTMRTPSSRDASTNLARPTMRFYIVASMAASSSNSQPTTSSNSALVRQAKT